MKIGLAIAPANALPSAFVVFRDELGVSIDKAAKLGYNGVEIALLEPGQVDVGEIKDLLSKHNLELPVISTGQVFSEGKIWFTHPDGSIRRKAIDRMKGMVQLASQFGAKVNIGRIRGFIHEGETRETAEGRFLACLEECADFAKGYGVELIIEPVNRYEINYINNCQEAVGVLKKLGRDNVKLMPDVFHMNIEDSSITGSLREAKDYVSYVHFADSNRWAPGKGHLDFPAIISTLREIGYDGYVTAEILPYPDPDTAARWAADYLKKVI